jgi:hypothetical protein
MMLQDTAVPSIAPHLPLPDRDGTVANIHLRLQTRKHCERFCSYQDAIFAISSTPHSDYD